MYKRCLSLSVLLILYCSNAVGTDIYRYVTSEGRVILTDRPKHSGYKRLVKTWKGWVEQGNWVRNHNWKENQKKYDRLIKTLARTYRLPHTLLHAVITTESAYDPNAVSRAGAVGLMQLMPATAQRYGVKDRRDPEDNIQGGTRYLRDLLQMFNNDLVLALAAYNAGESAVKRYGYKVPPYKETRNYVDKAIKYYRRYRETMS